MTVINFDPVVFGVPKPTPPAPPVLWAPGQHTWTVGADSWDLSGGTQGVRMQAGLRGLGMPEFTIYDDVSPAVSGSTYRGHIALPRDVMWPLWVFNNTSSEEWLATDRAFWRTMRPGTVGTWTYVARDGTTRTLACRFISDNNKAHDDDPGLFGWQPYMISLRANDPFWHGPRLSWGFGGAGADTPFWGPLESPGAPSYWIGGQFQLESGRVSNPGDEPAWPKWTLYGPFTSAAVGIGGNSVEIPFTVADGAWLYIDTDPTVRTAMHGTGGAPGPTAGTDRTADLDLVNWGSIPPGTDIALAMEMSGEGRIRVEIDPAYHRAY